MRAIVVALVAIAPIAGCGGAPPTPGPPANAGPAGPRAAGALSPFEEMLPRPLIEAIGGTPLYVADFDSLLLFADERLEADQMIAAWGQANGLTVLDPKATEGSVAAGARGLDATTHGACGPKVPRSFAIERWVHAGGNIAASVDCSEADQCTLQVAFTLDGRGVEYYAAPFDPDVPWRQGLHDALMQARDNGGHEQHGHGNNPVAIRGAGRDAKQHDLIVDQSRIADSSGLTAELVATCKLGQLGVSVLVADQGARCERFADSQMITEYDPAIVECACKVIATRAPMIMRTAIRVMGSMAGEVAATANGKRARGGLWGGDALRRDGVAWFQPSTIYPYVSDCFVDRTAVVESAQLDATVEFDANGVATAVQLGTAAIPLTPSEQTCLTAKLMILRTPCPDSPHPVGTVRIDWSVSEP